MRARTMGREPEEAVKDNEAEGKEREQKEEAAAASQPAK